MGWGFVTSLSCCWDGSGGFAESSHSEVGGAGQQVNHGGKQLRTMAWEGCLATWVARVGSWASHVGRSVEWVFFMLGTFRGNGRYADGRFLQGGEGCLWPGGQWGDDVAAGDLVQSWFSGEPGDCGVRG